MMDLITAILANPEQYLRPKFSAKKRQRLVSDRHYKGPGYTRYVERLVIEGMRC